MLLLLRQPARRPNTLDAEPGLDYVVAMAENAVLTRRAASAMAEVRALSEASGKTAHVYTETDYAARTACARALASAWGPHVTIAPLR